MAVLTVQKPVPAGVVQTEAAAAVGGDSFQNSGVEWLLVRNAHATAPRTVTIDAPGTCSFGLANHAAHDDVVVVAALTTKKIGPFAPGQYNDANGRVQITYSDAAADLFVGVHSTT